LKADVLENMQSAIEGIDVLGGEEIATIRWRGWQIRHRP
jgi:hypothetical protein